MSASPEPSARVRITARNRPRGVQAIAFRANNPKNMGHDADVVGGAGFQTRLTAYVPPGPYTATVLWADGSESAYPIDVVLNAAGRAVPVNIVASGPQLQPPSQEALDYKRGIGPRPESMGTPTADAAWTAPAGGSDVGRFVKLAALAAAGYFVAEAL